MRAIMKNLFTSHMRNPTAEDDYIFDMASIPGGVLKDLMTGVPAVTSISGTRYGVVNGVVTQFDVNQSPIEDNGLRCCPAFTQYFLNNQVPVTQSITLVAGSYCLWVDGTGSATFNGLTATVGGPKVFTLGSGFTGNCVISGTLKNVMLNSGSFPAPFTPTFGTTVSVVSEAGTSTTGISFDLDNALLSRLKAVLRGPSAQGHIELKFKSHIDQGWLPNDTALNLFTVANDKLRGLLLRKDTAGAFHVRVTEATPYSILIFPPYLVEESLLSISLDYGTYIDGTQKMRLTVNNVMSNVVAFAGSFGTQDLRFFFGNTVHAGWIVKDSLKVMDRPIW